MTGRPFIEETLRLFPPVPLKYVEMPRESDEADEQYTSSHQSYGTTRESLHARRRLNCPLDYQYAPILRMVGDQCGRLQSISLEGKKRDSTSL